MFVLDLFYNKSHMKIYNSCLPPRSLAVHRFLPRSEISLAALKSATIHRFADLAGAPAKSAPHEKARSEIPVE